MGGFSTSLPEIMWFVAGLVLILMSLPYPVSYWSSLGIGAWIVAALVYFGFFTSLTSQLFVFSAASLALLVVLRKWVKDKFYGHVTGAQDLSHNLDEFTGHQVIVLNDVIPGQQGGLVEFKGSDWRASSDEEIKKAKRPLSLKTTV